jgi:hypothetical protein
MNFWINLKIYFNIAMLLCFSVVLWGQEEDLLALLGEEETVDYTFATFKANRIINLHSVENTAKGVLDVKISHRFGELNGGFYELFGIDQANIRIGGDYGINDRLMIGGGRSNFEKTYDAFIKYKLLRQSSGKQKMPFTLSALSTIAVKTVNFQDPNRENYFSSRLYYTYQLLLGRKFSESFSLQLTPTMVHRNLVKTVQEKNDVYALGVGGRLKLTKRLSINSEYIYIFPEQLASEYRNSLSLGLDIETGGHVFQLHFTNSTSMIEKGFVTETNGEWLKGDIHFGFNVSRVISLQKDK